MAEVAVDFVRACLSSEAAQPRQAFAAARADEPIGRLSMISTGVPRTGPLDDYMNECAVGSSVVPDVKVVLARGRSSEQGSGKKGSDQPMRKLSSVELIVVWWRSVAENPCGLCGCKTRLQVSEVGAAH